MVLIRQHPHIWRAVTFALVGVLAAGILGSGSYFALGLNQPFLVGGGATVGLPAQAVSSGEVVDYVDIIENTSSRPVILRTLSFPRGLPAGAHLIHSGVEVDGDQPPGASVASSVGYGWPPMSERNGTNSIPAVMHPVAGFHLAPHATAFVDVAFVFDHSGAYAVGPLHIDAGVPAIGTNTAVLWPIQRTDQEYAVFCPGVSDTTCDSALKNSPSAP